MDWILSALVLLGNFLVGRKKIIGWAVLCVNSLAWIYYALTLSPKQYGLIPSAAINFLICVWALYGWWKEANDV